MRRIARPRGTVAHPGSASQPLRRNRDYRLLWLGQTLSQVGSNASNLAYPLAALALTGSPARAGLVGAANWLPYLLFQLVAGAFVDRWNRRATMLVCDGLNAAAVASIPVAYAFGALSFWQLLVVAFADRTLSTFFAPAEASALARVVPAERYAEAVGRNDAREHVASLAGPPLGGALFGLAVYAPFVADATSYAVSFGAVAGLRTSLAAPRAERRHLRAEILEGLRFIWAVPFLRASLFQAAGTNLTWSATTLTMIFVAHANGASGAEIGVMFVLLGAGGILGSLASRRLLARLSLPAIVLGIMWIWTVLIALLTATTDPFALGAIAGAAMFLAPTWNGAVVGKAMSLTPDELRGRVSAADALISFGLRPLALLSVGWLDEAHGGRVTFFAIAGWTLLIAILSTLSPSLRHEPA
jgi:MFS family permease